MQPQSIGVKKGDILAKTARCAHIETIEARFLRPQEAKNPPNEGFSPKSQVENCALRAILDKIANFSTPNPIKERLPNAKALKRAEQAKHRASRTSMRDEAARGPAECPRKKRCPQTNMRAESIRGPNGCRSANATPEQTAAPQKIRPRTHAQANIA